MAKQTKENTRAPIFYDQVWAATFGAYFVQQVGDQRGWPDADLRKHYAEEAATIADWAVEGLKANEGE